MNGKTLPGKNVLEKRNRHCPFKAILGKTPSPDPQKIKTLPPPEPFTSPLGPRCLTVPMYAFAYFHVKSSLQNSLWSGFRSSGCGMAEVQPGDDPYPIPPLCALPSYDCAKERLTWGRSWESKVESLSLTFILY